MGVYFTEGSCSPWSYSGHVRKGAGNSSDLTLRLTFRYHLRKRYLIKQSATPFIAYVYFVDSL